MHQHAGRLFFCALLLVAYGAPPAVKCARHNSTTLWVGRLLSDTLFELTPSGRSDQCTKDLQIYRDNVANLTLWAVKMFDASSKGPDGLLSGDNHHLGHYDQCLSISVPDIRISSRYTIAKISFKPLPSEYSNYRPLGMEDFKEPDPRSKVWIGTKPSSDVSKTRRDEFYWALCHPNSCSPDRLKSILEKQLSQVSGLNISVDVDPRMSSTYGDEEPLTSSHYIFFAAVGLNLLLMIIGTWYDMVVLKNSITNNRILKNLLKPFSVPGNLRRLLKKNDNTELSVINGMKFFAMCNIILGHRMLVMLGNAISNPDYNERATKTIWFSYFNSTLIVETFFVISGFLTYHVVIKEINRTKTFNLMVMLVYRWLRIIPVYGSLIAVYVFVLPYLGDGPLWKSIVLKESERCEISWWSNLAFLNNYISTENLCVIPSWYLACDMHFFLLGSVLTCAAWKSRKVGVTLMTGALILSVYIPSKMIYDNGYWGSQPIYVETMRDLNNEVNYTGMYIKSHNRATTYLVGLIIAVLYEKLKERDYKFSKKQLILSMIVCFILGNAVFLSTYILYIPGRPYDPWTHIIFFSVTRIIWALIVGFTIVAHGTTGLGFFSDLLGHEIFNCLGKLTFCVYMYQEIVQFVTVGTMRSPGYASHILITWMTCGDITVAYAIAIAVNFMVESPCDRIQKNFMQLLTKGSKVNDKEEKPIEATKEKESYRSNPIKA